VRKDKLKILASSSSELLSRQVPHAVCLLLHFFNTTLFFKNHVNNVKLHI